jgi:outer membrane protein, heavy metal efflux system
MPLSNRAATPLLMTTLFSGLCCAQEWTEAAVLDLFSKQTPYSQEGRARVAIAQAEARGRTFYTNPVLLYTRESAGLTEFFQAEQTLPVNGRLQLLRQAGASFVQATQADAAFSLWQARTNLRQAFYRLLAAQSRETVYSTNLKDIDDVIRVLRERELQGEGSKFDRLRAERERAEILSELALLRSVTVLDRAQLLAFLPDDVPGPPMVSGVLSVPPLTLNAADLTTRALTVREDYRAEQQRAQQYRIEQRAAERLRVPEPLVTAGLKRADIGQQRIAYGPAVGVSIPLPIFNKGQAEVARFTAEQERANARLHILSRQIRAAVAGNVEAFRVRIGARDEYERMLSDSGPELVRIATVAYQEGEINILQLLDTHRLQRQAQLRMIDINAAVKEAQIELERVVGEEFGR